MLQIYLQNTINYVRTHWKFFLMCVGLIVMVGIFNDWLSHGKLKKPEIIENKGFKANYSSDINFLECISIQHSCIYKNILNNSEKFIIENCKEEEFCNQGNSKNIKVKK
jgi:hypothetical protein